MRNPLIATALTLALTSALPALAQMPPAVPTAPTAPATDATDAAAAAASAAQAAVPAAPSVDAAAPAALGTSVTAVAADTAQIESARQAGAAWLVLADAGDYTGAWAGAGALLRSNVSEAQLTTALKAARAPLGTLVQRTPKSARTLTSGPGMPQGQYVLFTFTPQYANKASVNEQMTVQREADGQWRVIGYYVE